MQLKHINVNYFAWFQDIANCKVEDLSYNALVAAEIDVRQRFDIYNKLFFSNGLQNISNSPFAKNHPELKACYTSVVFKLADLKKLIIDAQEKDQKNRCQYCCIGKPKTFDHYLPISDFSEFSVHALNLLPCCKDCNGKKNSYWIENGGRAILNFYLDKIPNDRFLYVKINYDKPSDTFMTRFELRDTKKIYAALFEIIKLHFIRLDLLERYSDEANDEVSEIRRKFRIEKPHFTKIKSIAQILIQDANDEKKRFGANYWKAILKEALSNSIEFLNSI